MPQFWGQARNSYHLIRQDNLCAESDARC